MPNSSTRHILLIISLVLGLLSLIPAIYFPIASATHIWPFNNRKYVWAAKTPSCLDDDCYKLTTPTSWSCEDADGSVVSDTMCAKALKDMSKITCGPCIHASYVATDPCTSATCGDPLTATYECETADGVQVDDGYCTSPKPADKKVQCPACTTTGTWTAVTGDCSSTCGTGTQKVTQTCLPADATCDEASRPADVQQDCKGTSSCSWKLTDWVPQSGGYSQCTDCTSPLNCGSGSYTCVDFSKAAAGTQKQCMSEATAKTQCQSAANVCAYTKPCA